MHGEAHENILKSIVVNIKRLFFFRRIFLLLYNEQKARTSEDKSITSKSHYKHVFIPQTFSPLEYRRIVLVDCRPL